VRATGAIVAGATMWMAFGVFAAEPRFGVEYYTIEGKTAGDLRAAMRRLGPTNSAGRRSDGYTKWNIEWTFRYRSERKGGPCTAHDIDVQLEVTTTLPVWKRPDRVRPAVVAKWEQFSAALRLHEDGHYRIAADGAEAIRRLLEAHRDGPDCPTLERTLNEVGRKRLEEMRQRQAQYDVDTDSGRRQGTSVL
jgi:predicted secreted Zn-dependent protease